LDTALQILQRARSCLGDIRQVGQLAPDALWILAREQRGPGRQPAGILRPQLSRQCLTLTPNFRVLTLNGSLELAHTACQGIAPAAELVEPAADVRDRLLGRLQGLAGIPRG